MMKHRKLLYGFIIAFCVVSVAYGMYYIVIGRNKTNNKKSANVTTVNVAQANNSVTEPTGKIDATEELKKDFNKMFKNKIILNGYNSEQINKRVADKEIIFTVDAKELKRDDKYEISTHIPYVNINSEAAIDFNNTTQKVFVSKATEIVNNLASNLNDNNDSAVDNNDASADNTNSSNTNNTNTKSSGVNMTIYNVDYIAFVNKNILSVVIKATLKEGNDSQRVIIQTYNYNLSSNQKVDFTDLLQMENIQVDTAESKIKENIEAQSEYSDSLNETGNSVYKRDSSNKMYGASQTENFYLDEEENLYAIYAYGNDNNTTEFDIIKIND